VPQPADFEAGSGEGTETRVRSACPVQGDVFSGSQSCRGKNLRPRNGDGRAELDREFAAEEAPFSGGRFVVKIVATIR
jgi:hypothetical protein